MKEIDHDAAQLHRQLNGLDITGPRERADWVMQQCLLGCTVSDSNKIQIRDYLQMHFTDLAERAKRLEEALRHLVAVVPEPELVHSLDEPPAHRTMEEHEIGWALHEARAALASKDKP